MKKFILPVLAIALIAVSCNKLTSANTQTPGQTIYTTDTLADSLTVENYGSYEFGYVFHTTVTGSITELGCIVPVKDSNYRLTLWDAHTQTLLATVTIKSHDSLHYVYAAISPVAVSANYDYAVSMGNYSVGSPLNFYINFNKKGNTIFPFTVGDISIDGNNASPASSTPVFPAALMITGSDAYLMPVDIGFQPK